MVSALGIAGCGTVESFSEFDAPAVRPAPQVDAKRSYAANVDTSTPACGTPSTLLVHHDEAGRVDRLHATLSAEGTSGAYLVDTGSILSYAMSQGDVAGSDPKPYTATTIACRETTLPVIGRLPRSTPDGAPRVGVLGADLITHGSVLDMDLEAGTLDWYAPAPVPPARAIILPVERRKGWLVASGIKLGDRDVKLIVDTGSTNIIVFGKEPRPGELREDTVDGTMTPVTLWHGDGDVAFADTPSRSVPVDRTDHFPTLEGLITLLGHDVVGILGITAMGNERIVVGEDALMLVMPSLVVPELKAGDY